MDSRFASQLVGTLLPARRWPLMAYTFLAPVSIGLAIHALIQIDPRMLFWSVVTGGVALAIGSLPAARERDRAEVGHAAGVGVGGNRRRYVVFLFLSLVAVSGWGIAVVRAVAGISAVLFGVGFLVSQGRDGARSGGGSGRRSEGVVAAWVIPWTYALGPAGAIALAALAMRPTHLGAWRDPVYLGLGRVAAAAGVVFWIVVERELRSRARREGRRIDDRYLPYRTLVLLLALTGFMVPGGGSPYAVSWAFAWLIAAMFERRLQVG